MDEEAVSGRADATCMSSSSDLVCSSAGGVTVGNCRFRAVAHMIHGQESVWLEARQRLLDHLNNDPTGHYRDVAVASGAGISLQSL